MSRDNPRITAEKRGRRAETYAALYLRMKGYKIIKRRYKTRSGEIDIIAWRRNVIAIVEVKQRPTLEAAQESLHAGSLRRIESAAAQFRQTNRIYEDCDVRFDVIFVLRRLKIKHVLDAWRAY
ncbi:MAG: YraN family protein [Acidimicrobiales bacterium]|nr:YraN family protein [Hyphomonadaceae bacterium]RZV41156.1 MAG: YraN family protein [Acidimicrobiales bacterium]